MNRLNQTLLAVFLLILTISSCKKEEKYDDDQYGHCFVKRLAVTPGSIASGPAVSTTSFEYGQDDMVTAVNLSLTGGPSCRMTVTYNNNIAFADFYINGQRIGWSESPLDSFGNMISTSNTDSSGNSMGDETYVYNAEHQITDIAGYDFPTQTNLSLHIEYSNGNPTMFHTMAGDIRCEYNTGQKSSLILGRGNVALQAQKQCENIALAFSNDLLKTYDVNGVQAGQAMHVTYDFDRDGKVRKMYWSTTSSNNFGTTDVQYDCY